MYSSTGKMMGPLGRCKSYPNHMDWWFCGPHSQFSKVASVSWTLALNYWPETCWQFKVESKHVQHPYLYEWLRDLCVVRSILVLCSNHDWWRPICIGCFLMICMVNNFTSEWRLPTSNWWKWHEGKISHFLSCQLFRVQPLDDWGLRGSWLIAYLKLGEICMSLSQLPLLRW